MKSRVKRPCIYMVKGIRDKHKDAQYRIHKQSHAPDLSEGFERAYFENDALPNVTERNLTYHLPDGSAIEARC